MHATILLALISLLPLASCAPHSRAQRDFHHGGNLPILPAMPSSPAVTGNATRVFDAEDQGPTHVVSNPKVVPNPRLSKVTPTIITTRTPITRTSSSGKTASTKVPVVSANGHPFPKQDDYYPVPPTSNPGYVDCTANGGHCLVPGPKLGSTSSGKNLDVVHTGAATFFTPGLGACGRVNTDASIIVAVSHLLFDTFPGHTSNPNLNPICGKTLRVMWGGKYTNVVVVDRCEGCGMWDLDFSPTAWARFGQPPSAGRLMGAQWVFL